MEIFTLAPDIVNKNLVNKPECSLSTILITSICFLTIVTNNYSSIIFSLTYIFITGVLSNMPWVQKNKFTFLYQSRFCLIGSCCFLQVFLICRLIFFLFAMALTVYFDVCLQIVLLVSSPLFCNSTNT